MKKDLIIVGAGGFGREAYYLAKGLGWHIKGFIDDKQVDMTQYKITDANWIGTIKDWQPSENEAFAMGIASPKAKEIVAGILEEKGAEFVSVIHPNASIIETAEIGQGCVIGRIASIGDCVKLGRFVHVAGSCIGQDVEIGDFTTTTAFVNIAHGIIGKRVFIGSHSVILSKKIGDDAFVCAGSIVMTNVKAGTKVMGYPAKKIDL